ncbi:putative dehydrogenase [Desulfobaculum xiamenense]|uniref:Putative dehydrogenase n=1 Tax=Desulfobaculum xiamenense TaxID=995050 RepID=A0A846QS66_9BACT|nr:Gfo/Idh/MocA family oxidoreductase [Desulfobaculum xiamenense]NJB69213.1 putative dehydrogenase [Desulfobaculum xiamenense]
MLGVAVVGCGYWGPNLVRNVVACPHTRLVRACDLDAGRLARVLAPYPGVDACTDLAEVLADPRVEAVAVATPVHTHHAVARACLEAGRHVLVEKPMAASVAEGRELVELAMRKRLVLMCDHIFCYAGAVRAMKGLVDAGHLGELLYFDSVRVNLGLFQRDVNVIWDLAPHDLSVLALVTGRRPVAVTVHAARLAGWPQENIAYVALDFADGFIAHLHLNWLSPVKIRKTIIGGSERMIVWNDLDPVETLKVYDKGVVVDAGPGREERDRMLVSYRTGGVASPHVPQGEALAAVVAEFAAAIAEGREALTGGREGLDVLRVLEAAQRSVERGGERVRVDDAEERP